MAEAAAHLNPPKQARSKRTLERIVKGSLAILDEQGADGLTVQAIVERAGSSVGSFYARFAGKEDLLEYLGDRVWREAAARWDAALASRDWTGLDLREMVDGAVRLLGEAGSSRASYLEALGRAHGTRDDAYASFRAHVIAGLEELLVTRSEEMAHPDPAVAVPLGLRAVLSVLEDHHPPDGDPLPPERRMEEASTLLMSYLAGSSPHGEGSGDVDFFDIWG